MNPWFGQLRVGDACSFEAVDYRIAGVIACLQPDGSFWNEWLLVPEGETAAHALDARSARWLAYEEDIGPTFWQPVELPAGVMPGALDGLTKLEHRGRQYRRMERDHFTLTRVQGRADLDSRQGERVEYLEMLAGSDRLTFEWNGDGLVVHEGKRMKSQEVRDAFLRRGVDLENRVTKASLARQAAHRKREPVAARRENHEPWALVIGLLVVIPLILLESCAPRCQERYNAQLDKVEYTCSDGTVRNSRPWYGK